MTAHPLAARERDVEAKPTVEQTAATEQSVELEPYPVFAQSLPSVAGTPLERVVSNVARIVAVEGPIMGWRIHQVYKKCSDGSDSYDEFTRVLNRAISEAERQQLVTSDNPFNQTGNKPRTYRLPGQPKFIARQLGPRSVDIVPPAEIAEYRRQASLGTAGSEEDVHRYVADLLGLKQITTELRNVIIAAKKIQAPN